MKPNPLSRTRPPLTDGRSPAGLVLIATVGSVGDMHPFLGMGRVL